MLLFWSLYSTNLTQFQQVAVHDVKQFGKDLGDHGNKPLALKYSAIWAEISKITSHKCTEVYILQKYEYFSQLIIARYEYSATISKGPPFGYSEGTIIIPPPPVVEFLKNIYLRLRPLPNGTTLLS